MDCTLRRLTTAESLQEIKEKLGVTITPRYFYIVKKNIVDSSGQQLEYLTKNRNAYLAQFFERITEIQRHQRECWQMYEQAKEQGDNKFRLECLKYLGDISVTLHNLYSYLPEIRGLDFESDNDNDNVKAIAYEENNPEWKVGLEDEEAKF
jgi:hypothetical protein